MKPQQAIITFDPARIAQLDLQAEAGVFAHAIKAALQGKDYARERGIVSVDLLADGCEVLVRPPLMGEAS